MKPARRIDRLPTCPYQPGPKVQFHFEGRPIEGFENEPLAVALLAAGVRVFGRSIKYHRPRGPTCLHAHCSSCLLRVDSQPNIRSCDTLCREGQIVERQAGWPSTSLDVFRTVDFAVADRLDHHGMFTGNPVLNRMAARVVRKLSGFGDPPTGEPLAAVPCGHRPCEVLVVGAGAAGLKATLTLLGQGHQVVLLEAERATGGRLQDAIAEVELGRGDTKSGWALLPELQKQVAGHPHAEVLTGTPALAAYANPKLQVLASNPRQSVLFEPQRVVFCTGAYEQLLPFAGNDLPGLFTVRALDRLALGYGVIPTEPIAVVGDSDETLRLASLLLDRQVALCGVITTREGGKWLERLRAQKAPLLLSQKVTQARGSRWLKGLELAAPDRQGTRALPCGACAVEGPISPAYELGHHAGCRVTFRSESGYCLTVSPEGRTSQSQIFAAGHCAGASSLAEAIGQGMRAAQACSQSLKDNA